MAWQLCCHGMCKILQWCDTVQWSYTETNFHQIWITTEKNCSWKGHLKISLTINKKKSHCFSWIWIWKTCISIELKCFNHPCADTPISLLWHHNGCNGIWNHLPHDCLLNRSFRCRSNKTSKLCVTGLCAGNSPVIGEFPAQKTSNVENVSIWWRHHVVGVLGDGRRHGISSHIIDRPSL